ncbi:histone-lysine N-methyltransferase 2B-like [Oncorhynchus nerka]|uniref:histone-lysine N-methyltransferase 2B-like n=1 Tax=Oncorhynchus nerka TaxID=8023 RepID=UPI0031B7F01B
MPDKGENSTIAHSSCPQSESDAQEVDVAHSRPTTPSFSAPLPKPDQGARPKIRRLAGGLFQPLPSPGATKSKPHHILTISDLEETCMPTSPQPPLPNPQGHVLAPLGSSTAAGLITLYTGGSIVPDLKIPCGISILSGAVSCSDDELLPSDDECPPSRDQPHLRFEIKSDDGFSVEADSVEEAWRAVIDCVQEAWAGARFRQLSFSGMTGAHMLGLLHDTVVFLVEQLQGARRCHSHAFRFFKQISQEEDLPVNPSGCARSEVHLRKSTFDMFNFLASQHRQLPDINPYDEEEDEVPLKSTRRATSLELPMAMRFRHLERTSKEAVGVYRSAIHGRGLFCKRNIDAQEMVIEYAGIVIRSVLTDKREKYYDGKGIGCYMFRIDDFDVVDATMHGNAARFINHSLMNIQQSWPVCSMKHTKH